MFQELKSAALLFNCPICSVQFVICRSCYRGHRYCSHMCRDRGYENARIRARKKYSKCPEAKLDHCDRNRRYRIRKHKTDQNTVMDKSSAESLIQLQSESADKQSKNS